eukprot:CAMPEP_0116884424 /NCGR_PEP_ID=MMETSP0463-20121206/17320_1 /TAXON_ID=181622 /ORGANISM="Strombidinopsis sp, Strain SopsisLIS2011" /LENGTH=71 /DNA_ID=CAMNT_0004540923 /DNA_START=891 /DNA_END=1103 /DNA_ORIENTATION=-
MANSHQKKSSTDTARNTSSLETVGVLTGVKKDSSRSVLIDLKANIMSLELARFSDLQPGPMLDSDHTRTTL